MTIIELVNELSDIMNVGGEDIEVRVDREFYHSEPLAALMYFDKQNVIRIINSFECQRYGGLRSRIKM